MQKYGVNGEEEEKKVVVRQGGRTEPDLHVGVYVCLMVGHKQLHVTGD